MGEYLSVQHVELSIMSIGVQFSMQQPPPLINLPSLGGGGTTGLPTRRRRWWWIGIIIVILLVILLGGFIVNAVRRGSNVNYAYGQATQGDLTITVNATGPVQSGTYNITFTGAGGKIDEIDVVVGERVTKGQVLAQLDKTLLQDAVNQAQVTVNNAQAGLNAALASSDSSKGQSSANVGVAQTTLDNARANLNRVQAQGRANIDAAQTALNNAQANLDQVTNTATLQKQSALDTYNATGCNGTTPTPTATSTGTPTTTPTTNCTVARDTYNTTVNQADTNIATAQAQVNTAQAALVQAETTAATNNTTAQNQVNAAVSQLTSAQAGVAVSGTTAQSQVVTAQSQLNTALAQLVQAQHNLDNATLKAPHDGTITQINGNIGGAPGVSATSTSTQVSGTPGASTTGGTFIQIVDASVLQVLANVNEADIAKLGVGETVSFTVNAYGNQQFTGKVSAVPPIGQTVSNVVTYPVTIDVDPDSLKGAHLLPAMTANITVNAVQHKNVLLLPVNVVNFSRLASSGSSTSSTPQLIRPQDATTALNQARRMLNRLEISNPNLVSEGPMPAFVIERSGQGFVAKPVVLGLTDGTSYEVLEGLSLSDRFVVNA
jgi:multidrug efflux pump subunit AcrA (membrane-fusion protein)